MQRRERKRAVRRRVEADEVGENRRLDVVSGGLHGREVTGSGQHQVTNPN